MSFRRNDRGVAMITVILVAATMTVVVGVGAFSTIREFQAGADDRRASESLSIADAGLDRMIEHLEGGTTGWGSVSLAGCLSGPSVKPKPTIRGSVGNGSFIVDIGVFDRFATDPDDRFPGPGGVGGACTGRSSSARAPQEFLINSVGCTPVSTTNCATGFTAKRTVRQVVRVTPLGLPVGLFANIVNAGGTPNMQNITMVSETKVVGRDKLTPSGTDPWYFMSDFYDSVVGVAASDMGTTHVPAGIHSVDGIFVKSNGTDPEFEDAQALNCGDWPTPVGNFPWDSDNRPGRTNFTITGDCGPGNVPGPGDGIYPTSSRFPTSTLNRVAPRRLDDTLRQRLRSSAISNGVFCTIPTSGAMSCTVHGAAQALNDPVAIGDLAAIIAEPQLKFVAYFEFQGGDPLSNSIKWKADWWDCAAGKNVTIIVANGGFDLTNGAKVNGAVFADGQFKYGGTPTFNGTIVAKEFVVQGSANFTLDSCWVDDISGTFLDVRQIHWSEVDR